MTAIDLPDGCDALILTKSKDNLPTELAAQINSDKKILRHPAVLDELVKIRDEDKIGFELLLSGIKGISATQLNKILNLHLNEQSKMNTCSYSKETLETARKILANGNPIEFIMEQYHRNHQGDDSLGLGCLCSFASGSSLMSSGIQPSAHSDNPGEGKTDAMRAMFHLIDRSYARETSVSAKSLYYDSTIEKETVIFSDDVEWSRDLISTVKRAMSNFQSPTEHQTVSDDRSSAPRLSIPERLLWWFSSVDAVNDSHLLDRQFFFDVDSSEEHHHHQINAEIGRRRSDGRPKFEIDEEILVARAITRNIRERGPFKVLIPFQKFIIWNAAKNHRDFNKFFDLIDAFAILNFSQRTNSDGELIASIEDYKLAKRIFANRQQNIRGKMTNSEIPILKAMATREEWTQAELVKVTGMTQSTVSRRLNRLLENTNFVTKEKSNGNDVYKLTENFAPTILGASIVEIKIPTSRYFTPIEVMQPYAGFMQELCNVKPVCSNVI